MSCADVCLFEAYDYDPPSFHAVTTVRARTPHRCCECGDVIPVGAHYERASGKTDGSMWTAKTCLPCAEVRRAFACNGWVYGDLWAQAAEDMFTLWRKQGAWDCLARLTTPEAVAKCNSEFARWAEVYYHDD